MKRCYPFEKLKDSLIASASVQSQPHLALCSTIWCKPLCASWHHGWLIGLTVRTCMCNNKQLWRFMPTIARKVKPANYLHLQTEQLFGTCQ